MASNSDTIYHVLSYIKAHPDKVFTKPDTYDNVVEMYLDDTVKLGNPEIYFLNKNSRLIECRQIFCQCTVICWTIFMR